MSASAVETTNPYLAARHVHNERHRSLAKSVHNWQLEADGLLLSTVRLAAGLTYATSKQQVIPSVVAVNEAGSAAIKELQPWTVLDPLVIAAQRKHLLTEIRTRSTTDALVRRQMPAASQHCLAPAQQCRTRSSTEQKVADLVQRGRTFPVPLSVTPLTPQSERVRGKEALVGHEGAVLDATRGEAERGTTLVPPQRKDVERRCTEHRDPSEARQTAPCARASAPVSVQGETLWYASSCVTASSRVAAPRAVSRSCLFGFLFFSSFPSKPTTTGGSVLMSSSPPHPYVDTCGLTAHHDRYLNLARGKWHWQVTAWLALLVVAVQAAAIAYMYGQRKEYAYAVQIDELGAATYVRDLPPQDIHSAYLVAAQVANFLRGIRTITTDPVAFQHGMNAAYAVCLKDAQGYIKRYYDTEKPLEILAQGGGVYPDGIQVTPLSATSYRARWTERLIKGGEIVSESQWEATVQVTLTAPTELTRDQRQRNPLGVWVANLDWIKL